MMRKCSRALSLLFVVIVSVLAVNTHNNHAFVPLPANNVFADCLNGCIGVFGTPNGDQ